MVSTWVQDHSSYAKIRPGLHRRLLQSLNVVVTSYFYKPGAPPEPDSG